jgi:MFS transporter, DHA1 family, tetracycline resistance protein
MTSEKKSIRSLLGIIFIDQTYLTLTFPLLTLIFFDSQSRLFPADTPFATRSIWYGSCVALPNMINIFFAPALSALSDEFGRKKILIIEIFSALIFTLTVGLGVYLGMLGLIFLGFIVKGAGSRTNPTALAIIGDTAPKENKILYMGYLQFAISVGASIGPILGGYFANRFFFNELNFSLPFFLAAGLALINTFLALIILRETLKKRENNKAWGECNFRAIKQIIIHPDVLRISLILLLIQISWSTYYQFIPPILKTLYGFDSHQLGWFIGMIACWLAVATGIGIKILHRYLNVRQMLLISVYLVLAGLIITLLACAKLLPFGSLLVWVGAIPTAAGDVIAYSCLTALYSNTVAHEKQGKVMGVSFIVVASVWATTGFVGGLLMSISPLLPLIVAPCGIIAALVLVHANFGRKLVLNYNAA